MAGSTAVRTTFSQPSSCSIRARQWTDNPLLHKGARFHYERLFDTIDAVVPIASDAVDDLAAALDRLAADPVDHIPAHALGDELARIRRQIDRLEAQFIRRLHRFDRGHGALAEGAVSTVSWLRATCGLTGGAAVDRVRMARVLAELPEAATSFRAGTAPFTNVSLIARLADDVGVESVRTVEHILTVAAEKLDVGRMRLLVACTRHRLDADGVLDEDNRNHDRRWFACDQTYGGVFVLRGELDAEGGALVRTALDALTTPCGPNDDRTASQRRADAIVDMASRQLASGALPAVHGQRPHLTVTVAAQSLQGAASQAPADLGGVGPIHIETVRRIACDAVRTVATVTDTAAPMSVGRATRTIPAALRTALSLRDKGCRFPGCDRPPEWTDGHHVKHWADGGETSLHNLVLLCRRHHRMVHERGWQIRLEGASRVTVSEPPGRPIHSRVASSVDGRLARGDQHRVDHPAPRLAVNAT